MSGIIPIEAKAGSVKQVKSFNIFLRHYQPSRAYIFGATTARNDANVRRLAVYCAGIGELGKI